MELITPKLQDKILYWKLMGVPDEKIYEYAMSLVQDEVRQAQAEAQKVIDASERAAK